MEHIMRLHNDPFNLIKDGYKTIELRLNDEKRRKINIDDIIIFTHVDTGEELRTKVVNLYQFDSFKKMFSSLDNNRFGLNKNDTFEIMYNFYTKEDEKKYGGLAIEIKLI